MCEITKLWSRRGDFVLNLFVENNLKCNEKLYAYFNCYIVHFIDYENLFIHEEDNIELKISIQI